MRPLCALTAVLALSATNVAWAQDPPPEPVGRLTLSETSPGAYQLEFRAVSDRSPYVVAVHTSRIGTDQGVVEQLSVQQRSDFVFDLPLPITGMTEEGCYRVSFSVVANADDLQTADFSQGLTLDTPGCVDAAGSTSFPAYDSVIVPPPPPPTDVRVTPHAGGWKVEWRDNSADEIAFDVGIIFLDRPWADGGGALSGLELPEVPANQTAAYALGTGQFFVADEPAEPMCGYAMVLVFAIGPDSPSIWPGNTTVPACFGGGTLTFPEAGDGGWRKHSVNDRAALMLFAGVLVAGSGLWLRYRSDQLTS